jgi:hypothetical protein
MFGRKRQECDIPRALDGLSELALMRRACAGEPTGQDLAAIGYERSNQPHVFVINHVNFLFAEFADLAATKVLLPGA